VDFEQRFSSDIGEKKAEADELVLNVMPIPPRAGHAESVSACYLASKK
jgi:hypothetical protein